MKHFIIKGPTKGVKGNINISGAKNSCLPLMAASILFEKKVVFKNIPLVNDVYTMKNLLIALGSKVVINKSNIGSSIWTIFYSFSSCWHIFFLSIKINYSIFVF